MIFDYTTIVEEFEQRDISPGQLRKLLYLLDKGFINYETALVILEVGLDLKRKRLGY